jgi:hypothetical protein
MNHKLSPLFPLLIAVLLTVTGACSSDSDYTSSTDTRDCVVTEAVMGTLYRYLHTTASTGADSTYKVAVTGSL